MLQKMCVLDLTWHGRRACLCCVCPSSLLAPAMSTVQARRLSCCDARFKCVDAISEMVNGGRQISQSSYVSSQSEHRSQYIYCRLNPPASHRRVFNPNDALSRGGGCESANSALTDDVPPGTGHHGARKGCEGVCVPQQIPGQVQTEERGKNRLSCSPEAYHSGQE